MMIGYKKDGNDIYSADSIGNSELTDELQHAENLCISYCDSDDCRKYNTTVTSLGLSKFIEDKDNPNINYQDTGFEKISNLIELSSVHFQAFETFLMYSYNWINYDPLESPILSLEQSFGGTTVPLGLRFEEYMLKRYLEKLHSGYNVKKIMDGIFYINGIMYYFKCEIPYFIRVTHNLKNTSLDDPTTNAIIRESGIYNYFSLHPKSLIKAQLGSYSILHIDTSTIVYQKTDADIIHQTPKCDIELGKSPSELLLSDARRRYDYAHFGIGTENNLLYDMHGNVVSMASINTEMFNLWVLLYSHSDIYTLGFIDFIDEHSHNQNQVQESIYQGIGVGDTNYRNNVLAYPGNGVLLNLNNVRTFEKTGNTDDPTLDLNKMYTYTMRSGDAFRFNTKFTPHTGFDPGVVDGLRISTESRYMLFTADYNLSSPDLNVLTYMSTEIDNFFAEQLDIVFRIHQSLSDDIKKQRFQGTFTNVMFRELMDKISYEDYFTNKERSIRNYLHY